MKKSMLYIRKVFNRGKRVYNKWVKLMKEYKEVYPNEYKELKRT